MWFCQKPTIPRPREGKAMVRIASLFSQLLHHFPRTEFFALVEKHGAAVRTKGFPCWTQFVALLFYHPPGPRTDSLRESCPGLSCCLGKLPRLGVIAAPKRSTLSYANRHRPSSLFRALFFSSKLWSAFVPKAPWTGKRVSSNSRTSS
ncbi:hypothetical protein DFAR_1050026 [Desulfarculales bacterium]